ncbi:hypothetical protein A8C56_18845 [Niabella ginsenosidivorans]|uniref:Uncharacterized protein n=1 Tax=Niabella ginsenosidivorans TaxID=1176587 RepID=A0A1A9I7X2_9BACT|nr:hypothetical protein A8C56_18845 [Niabella ginsenosidivorans]
MSTAYARGKSANGITAFVGVSAIIRNTFDGVITNSLLTMQTSRALAEAQINRMHQRKSAKSAECCFNSFSFSRFSVKWFIGLAAKHPISRLFSRP